MNVLKQVCNWVMIIAMTLLIVAASLGIYSLQHRGARIIYTRSAAMKPLIQPNDALIIRPGAEGLGQVVAYQNVMQPATPQVARVTGLDPAHALTQLEDQGSGSTFDVPSSDVDGRIVLRVPDVGLFMRFIQQPGHLLLTLYMPALAIIMYVIKRYQRRNHHPTYRLASYR